MQLEQALQKERAERKLKEAELEQMITQPNVRYRRGKYTMRTHAPTCGFGSWDSDWFLGNIAPAYAWFKERKKCPLYFTSALVFITVVLFLGNDSVKLVEFGNHPKDRNGVPIYVDLNTKDRLRRRVSTNGAVEQIFKHSFLPEYECVRVAVHVYILHLSYVAISSSTKNVGSVTVAGSPLVSSPL